tara:strand:- start:1015 stop:1518 length:504 start_codon:yes stop_codon:yes gene_type:complete
MSLKIILLTSLAILFGCSSKQTEEYLLNKKNPIGSYGNILSETDIIETGQLILNAEENLGKRFLVSGSIIEVCPMRGCWVQIQDDSSKETIRIKVTDGEIVFPLSAVGNKIIAEGDFIKLELSEKQAKNWKHHLALEQGIELDTSNIVLSDKDYYEYRLNSNAAKIF